MSRSPSPEQSNSSSTRLKPGDSPSFIETNSESPQSAVLTSDQNGILSSTSETSAQVPETEPEVVVEVCRFFAKRGWCKFRKACRYLHERRQPVPRAKRQQDATASEQLIPDDAPAIEEGALASQSDSSSKEERERSEVQAGKPKSICTYFVRTGRCSYGLRCKFLHQREKPPRSQTGGEEVEGSLEDKATENATKEDKNDQHSAKKKDSGKAPSKQGKRRLCRYYKAGHCTMGNRCRFWHPKDALDVEASKNDEHHIGDAEIPKPIPQVGESKTNKLPSRPVVSKPGRYKLEDMDEGEMAKLRETEIEQLGKRYPNGEGETLGSRYAFQFIFAPSDPDWPYDARSVPLRFLFPKAYPKEALTVSLPEDDVLPETLRRHLRLSITEWVQERHRSQEKSGTVQLMVRPLLHWIDRHMEEMFTAGLKKYQLELVAQAAGMEFIPASRLQERQQGESSGEETKNEEDEKEEEEGREGEDQDDNQEEQPFKATEEAPEESNITSQTTKPSVLDPARKGTEMKLHLLQLGENVSTLLAIKIHLIIQCGRCKNQTELITPPDRMNMVECNKCRENQLVNYRASLVHQFSHVIGYLDLQNCVPFDLLLSECHFQLGCLACSKDMIMEGLPPGQPKETWCRHCHQKMRVAAETTKFHNLQPAETVLDTSKAHNVQVKKLVRIQKDPAIQEGKSLPNNGTCKHYKKSYRWLRFPCCGKAYPCDLCHDDHEADHDMKFANRMICGYCCKEQAYAAEKPCSGCQSNLTKKSSAYWEGGKGCRDKTKMSRDDVKKYSNTNKTVSRKAQAQQESKKKAVKQKNP